MKQTEVKTKTPKELKKMIEEKTEELFALKLQFSTGQLAQTSKLKTIKKDIARLLTILNKRGGDGIGSKTDKR